MTGNTAWRRPKAVLAQRLGRDFERACLPFLRLFWPATLQATALKKWDNQGIDLLCLADDGRIDLAVQCKTSEKHELGNAEISDAKLSFEKFRKAGHKCATYLFIINGDGRNLDYNKAIESELQSLIADGIAERAEFWPRSKLLDQAFVRMRNLIVGGLRQRAAQRQSKLGQLFRFGEVYLSVVPVKEEQLILKVGSPCARRTLSTGQARPLTAILHDSKQARWTLLTGIFGAGKTTAALEASSRGAYTLIFVAASELGQRAQRQGAATIGQEIADTLQLFSIGADPIDGFYVLDEKDEDTFTELAGPALASLLRSETPEHILVIDGLDENRLYLRPDGLQLLNNQIAELKCPIVLTTRLEHLSSMFGNFEALLEGLGSGRKSATPARLLTLEPWTTEEVRLFIETARRHATTEDQANLTLFVKALEDGSLTELYGDLPFHPLFLQFILDDVCSDGLNTRRRTELVESWVRRKMSRDIQHHGAPVDGAMDRYQIIDGLMVLMERIAAAMTEQDIEIQLTEQIDSRLVEELSTDIFNVKIPIAILLLYGFVVPVDFRRGSRLEVRFVLRVMQEYFLARHIKRADLLPDLYPASVQDLVRDLPDDDS